MVVLGGLISTLDNTILFIWCYINKFIHSLIQGLYIQQLIFLFHLSQNTVHKNRLNSYDMFNYKTRLGTVQQFLPGVLLNATNWEADTIPTDSLPTDAITTAPQSGQPSTPIACLGICRNNRNRGKLGGGLGVAHIECMALIKAPRWPRWVGPGEGIPVASGVPPPPKKLQCTSNTIVLPLIFGIWFCIFPIGTARRPIQLQSATRRPNVDCRNSVCRNRVCRNSAVYPHRLFALVQWIKTAQRNTFVLHAKNAKYSGMVLKCSNTSGIICYLRPCMIRVVSTKTILLWTCMYVCMYVNSVVNVNTWPHLSHYMPLICSSYYMESHKDVLTESQLSTHSHDPQLKACSPEGCARIISAEC